MLKEHSFSLQLSPVSIEMLEAADLQALQAFTGELFHHDEVAPLGYKFPHGGFF